MPNKMGEFNFFYLFLFITLLVFIFVLIRHFWHLFKSNEMDTYLKNHPDRIKIRQAYTLFDLLYADVNPVVVAQRARNELGIHDDALTYGEVLFFPFFLILDSVHPKKDEIFYDLGSGSGKAVFVAALCFQFAKIVGIEYLPALSVLSTVQNDKYKNLVRKTATSIQFINGDILKEDFSEADILFIAATCFSYPTWEKLIDKMTRLKPGSRIIVTTKKIHHEQFQLMSASVELMSWGINSVNIYLKIK